MAQGTGSSVIYIYKQNYLFNDQTEINK